MTPYVQLRYPAVWKNVVSIEVKTESVVFSHRGERLFEIFFQSGEGEVLGTVLLSDRNIVVSVHFADLNRYSDQFEKNCEYQEGINQILSCLAEDYSFVFGQAVEYDDTSTFDIVTPIVTLKYPNKWKDKVQVSVTEGGVKFSTNGTKLFDLMFVGPNGFLLGTYNGTPIYIVDYTDVTEEQAAMQEDVNVILSFLFEDPNFSM